MRKPLIVPRLLATIATYVSLFSPTLAEPDRGTTPSPKSTLERNLVEAAMKTENSAANCAARIQSFVEELEALLPQATSVYPVQALLKKYFPIEGCDPDQVLAVCRRSNIAVTKALILIH